MSQITRNDGGGHNRMIMQPIQRSESLLQDIKAYPALDFELKLFAYITISSIGEGVLSFNKCLKEKVDKTLKERTLVEIKNIANSIKHRELYDSKGNIDLSPKISVSDNSTSIKGNVYDTIKHLEEGLEIWQNFYEENNITNGEVYLLLTDSNAKKEKRI